MQKHLWYNNGVHRVHSCLSRKHCLQGAERPQTVSQYGCRDPAHSDPDQHRRTSRRCQTTQKASITHRHTYTRIHTQPVYTYLKQAFTNIHTQCTTEGGVGVGWYSYQNLTETQRSSKRLSGLALWLQLTPSQEASCHGTQQQPDAPWLGGGPCLPTACASPLVLWEFIPLVVLAALLFFYLYHFSQHLHSLYILLHNHAYLLSLSLPFFSAFFFAPSLSVRKTICSINSSDWECPVATDVRRADCWHSKTNTHTHSKEQISLSACSAEEDQMKKIYTATATSELFQGCIIKQSGQLNQANYTKLNLLSGNSVL